MSRCFKKYVIEKKIGEGGYGEVYLAKQRNSNQIVALKVFTDESKIRNLKKEWKILGQLNHPNLVKVYDYDLDNNHPFLVLEYISGKSLQRLLQKHKKGFELQLATGILLEICQGVEYLHQNRILHLDLKPSNVIISDEGILKIVDFGIAKRMDKMSKKERLDIAGTRLYAAPEQIQGYIVDEKADLFSLGVLYYELLTGEMLFKDGYTLDTEKIIYSKAQISLPVKPILIRLLKIFPDQRFKSATELRRELKRIFILNNLDYRSRIRQVLN